MSDRTVHFTIEILGKAYPIRCLESELSALQEAAQYLNEQMVAVQKQGICNPDRVAVITALNITHHFLQLARARDSDEHDLSARLAQWQEKLDVVIDLVPHQRDTTPVVLEPIHALDEATN